MAGFYDTLEQNIAKYGGSDEAYKLKLKTNIREALGYSNYRSQASSAMKKPLDLSLMKGNITPAGVKSLVGGAVNMQEQEAGTYQGMAGKVDTAAGQLAADQISKARAAASARQNALGYENGVLFQPKDQLDIDLLKTLQNPYNTDGSVKSLQQIQAELNDKYKPGRMDDQGIDAMYNYSPEEINQRIAEKLPKDFIQNQDKYTMMLRGMSQKQAETYSGFTKIPSLAADDPRKLVYETLHPEMAKFIEDQTNFTGAIRDSVAVDTAKDPETGEVVTKPKYTFSQLQEKYPSISKADLQGMAGSIYKNDMQNMIDEELTAAKGTKTDEILGMSWLTKDSEVSMSDMLKSIYNKETPSTTLPKEATDAQKSNALRGGYDAIKDTNFYTELKIKAENNYGDIFTPGEIERMIYENIMSRIR